MRTIEQRRNVSLTMVLITLSAGIALFAGPDVMRNAYSQDGYCSATCDSETEQCCAGVCEDITDGSCCCDGTMVDGCWSDGSEVEGTPE